MSVEIVEVMSVEVMSVGIVEVEWEMRRTFLLLARARPYIIEKRGPCKQSTHGVEHPDKSIG